MNKKITWKEFLILVASRKHDEGIMEFHHSVFYEAAKEYENDGRLNFKILDEPMEDYPSEIKYKKDIRTNVNKLSAGDNWVFKKVNYERDGFYFFNTDYFNPDYSDFFNLDVKVNENNDDKVDDYSYRYNIYSNKQRDSHAQRVFSKNVKKMWGEKCAFCNLAISQLIEGAHIHSEKEEIENNFFNPQNGLPLCKNCHKLFDNNEIKISQDDLKIYVNKDVRENYLIEIKEKLEISDEATDEFFEFLKKRNEY